MGAAYSASAGSNGEVLFSELISEVFCPPEIFDQPRPSSPEKLLILALVARALDDLTEPDRRIRLDACNWIESNDDRPFGFAWCCDEFGLDVEAARQWLAPRITAARHDRGHRASRGYAHGSISSSVRHAMGQHAQPRKALHRIKKPVPFGRRDSSQRLYMAPKYRIAGVVQKIPHDKTVTSGQIGILTGWPAATVNRALQWAVRDGLVERVSQGHYRRVR